MIGTKNSEMKEMKNKIIEYLYNCFEFKEENIKIIDIQLKHKSNV